jgi:hypothetical protein
MEAVRERVRHELQLADAGRAPPEIALPLAERLALLEMCGGSVDRSIAVLTRLSTSAERSDDREAAAQHLASLAWVCSRSHARANDGVAAAQRALALCADPAVKSNALHALAACFMACGASLSLPLSLSLSLTESEARARSANDRTRAEAVHAEALQYSEQAMLLCGAEAGLAVDGAAGSAVASDSSKSAVTLVVEELGDLELADDEAAPAGTRSGRLEGVFDEDDDEEEEEEDDEDDDDEDEEDVSTPRSLLAGDQEHRRALSGDSPAKASDLTGAAASGRRHREHRRTVSSAPVLTWHQFKSMRRGSLAASSGGGGGAP